MKTSSTMHPNKPNFPVFFFKLAFGASLLGLILGLPSAPTIILTSGTVLALTALVWRPYVFKDFQFSLGIIIIGLFAPYIILWNGGYPPHFSNHLLPLALLSVIVVIDLFIKKASDN